MERIELHVIQYLTIEAVNGLLPQCTRDASINSFVLIAFVVQEVFQQVQHFSHLGKEREKADEA